MEYNTLLNRHIQALITISWNITHLVLLLLLVQGIMLGVENIS